MTSRARFAPYLVAGLTSLTVLVLVFAEDRAERDRQYQQARAVALDRLGAVRARLETALNARIHLGRGLMVYAATHPGVDRDEFEVVARLLQEGQSGVRALQLARDSVVSHIYPLTGNEAALGLRILAHPEQREAAQRAISTGKTIFAGPVRLVQGGNAFVVRTPVYLPGKEGRGRYWGLAQVLIDRDVLFHEAGLTDPASPLRFCLRGRDGTGAAGPVFWGDEGVYAAHPVTLDVNLPEGSWQLAAVPVDGWRTGGVPWLRWGGGVLALLAGVLAWFVARSPMRLKEAVEQAREALEENELRLRHLFEQAPLGLILVDREGRIRDCNWVFIGMMGAPKDKVLGFDMLNDPTDTVLVPYLREALEGRRTVVETPYTSTLGGRHGDYRYLFQPIFMDGNVQGVLGFVEDISERKEAERELRALHSELEARVASRTEELAQANRALEQAVAELERTGDELRHQLGFTQALIDAIPNPVFYKDKEGRYLGCNRAFAELVGQSAQSLRGKTVFDVSPPELAEKYHLMDQALLARQGLQAYEHTVRAADGSQRDILFNKATFTDGAGQVAGLVGVMVDLTERKREQERLAAAEAMFRGLVEQSLAGIYIIQDGVFAYVNPTFARIFGYDSPEEIIGRLGPFDLTVPEDRDRVLENIRLRLDGEIENIQYSFKGVRKDGVPRDIQVQGRVAAYNGKPAIIGILLDVTEQKKAEQQLNFLAYYDVLTGLPNRSLFLDHLHLAMAGAKRHESHMALLFLDLDRFKEINDTLGHHIGDLLLQNVAGRLKACLRETDTVARMGGDEFAIIQTDLAGIEGAESLAQKIIASLSEPFLLDGQEVYTSTSIGITVYPLEDVGAEQLLKNADMAMYSAKNQGRNTFQFFSATMNVEAHRRMSIQAGLRQALEQGELVLHYQPKISFAQGAVVGAEALLRWRKANGEIVPPMAFIPVAEESGLIIPIGEWALREACRQMRAWEEAGLPPVRVSVNLSPVQFRRSSLVVAVTAALAEVGVDPARLELEITESLLMEHDPATLSMLERLRETGIRISVDDFGTGYSSLHYLKRLPVDILKIDRSFIDDIPQEADDVAIARAIISLGHHLNLQVVAEGVETMEQAEFLRANGCDEVQGYLYGRPLPPAEFAALLRQGVDPVLLP